MFGVIVSHHPQLDALCCSGLYGPTFFRATTFSMGGCVPKMSDLKAPTYEDHGLGVA
jgi:hypothetical protein